MRARQQLSQSLPMITQFLMSPQIQEALSDQGLKLDMVEIAQLWFDVMEVPGRQSIITDLTDEDKKRIAAKNEFQQTQSLEAQKHRNALAQIEEKGISQAGGKVIENLASHVSPEQMAGGNGAADTDGAGLPSGAP